jgi:hypothetical protein
MNVRDPLVSLRFKGRTNDPCTDFDVHAGNFALEGTEVKLASLIVK